MADKPTLRAAVIGLGRMGMHHVRACADTQGIDLVAVLDARREWTDHVGAESNSRVAPNLESLIGTIDVALVVVPTRSHAATAIPLLRAGIACLVEKPIAAEEDEAKAMIAAAEEGHATLRIGHIERFNPALITLRTALHERLSAGDKVQRFTARRLNLASDRTYDVDAVLDLMIHDLDLLNTIHIGHVEAVEIAPGAMAYEITATLTLSSGATAHFEVSRVAQAQNRDLVIDMEHVTFKVDYAARTVTCLEAGQERQASVAATDPLRAQLNAFITAVHAGESDIARGDEGLAALYLANRVRHKAGLT